jgi:hypothetical protein
MTFAAIVLGALAIAVTINVAYGAGFVRGYGEGVVDASKLYDRSRSPP